MRIMYFIIFAILGFGLMVGGLIDQSRQYHKQFKATMRDYQVEIDMDSIYIFDGDREVGQAAWTGKGLDTIFLNDNK